MRVAFHRHVETHGETPEELDRLVSLFSPADLALCLKAGHYVYGGGGAAQLLENQVSRVSVLARRIFALTGSRSAPQENGFLQGRASRCFWTAGQRQPRFSKLLALLRRGSFDSSAVVEADVLPGGVGSD